MTLRVWPAASHTPALYVCAYFVHEYALLGGFHFLNAGSSVHTLCLQLLDLQVLHDVNALRLERFNVTRL